MRRASFHCKWNYNACRERVEETVKGVLKYNHSHLILIMTRCGLSCISKKQKGRLMRSYRALRKAEEAYRR